MTISLRSISYPFFKNSICSIGFFFCFISLSTGQEKEIVDESAIHRKNLKDYVQWSRDYGMQKRYDSATKYIEKALVIQKSLGNERLSALVYFNHARLLYWQTETTTAKKFIAKNLDNLSLPDSTLVENHLLLSEILMYEQNPENAMLEALAAEKLVLKKKILSAKDSIFVVDANLLMAHIQKKSKNSSQAIAHYNEAFRYCQDPGLGSYIQFYKAEIFKSENNLRFSINLVNAALKTAKNNNLKLYIPTYYLALSEYYLQLKKPDSALLYSKLGLVDNVDCHIDGLLNNSGMGYLQLGVYDKAANYFNEALTTEISEIPKASIHKNLSKTYKASGDYKKAFYHSELYIKLQDSLNEATTRDKIFEISEKYVSEKKAMEIDMLQVKDEASQEVISEQKSVLLFVSVSLVLALLLLGFIVLYYLKQKKQRKLLFEKNLQLVHKLERIQKEKEVSAVSKTTQAGNVDKDIQNKEAIVSKIETLITDSFYLQKTTSLVSVAKDIDTNTTYLSKIINDTFNKPFTHFVNDLRIGHMLQKIENNPAYRTYTIDHIADDVGFSSSSAFYNAFKKFTGLTPSYYIKKRLHLQQKEV